MDSHDLAREQRGTRHPVQVQFDAPAHRVLDAAFKQNRAQVQPPLRLAVHYHSPNRPHRFLSR
eukprot:scaffold1104_cov299-Prasinococcus_capsulatus_cf.AAC.20